MSWKITYYSRSVFNAVMSLPVRLKARYLALTDRMELHGPNLGMPHTRALGGGLFELRVKSEEGIARVFYCTMVEAEVIMLHSFVKKSQLIPKKELQLARQRLKDTQTNG